jgi:superfamily II DNA/RNA helicase
VFTRTKRAAQRLAEDLEERGFDASPLHGDMQQVAREKALKRFREGKLRVLVATDVAARGIDVADVTHVINYSCPEDEKTYVHRIGRTGRAGASGIAVTFVDWADVTRWKVINRMLELPFDNPAETYSTSEHFFHDLGIAPGTKGRIKPPKPVEAGSSDRSGRGSGRGSGGGSGSGSGSGSAERSGSSRPRQDRSRSRTRNGQPVEGADASATGSSAPAAANGSGEGSEGAGNGGRSRNRRRRRTSGSAASAAPAASSD